jgi:hypothetical protein
MRIARRKLQDELRSACVVKSRRANNLDMAKASRENVVSRFSEFESETAQDRMGRGFYPSCYPLSPGSRLG